MSGKKPKKERNPIQILHISRGGLEFEVVVNEKAKVVVAKLDGTPNIGTLHRDKYGQPALKFDCRGWSSSNLKFQGTARCLPQETWNSGFGINIAIQRCWEKMKAFMFKAMVKIKSDILNREYLICRIGEDEMLSFNKEKKGF